MRIQEEKIELQKNVHRRICVSDIYLIFCRFFHLLSPFHVLRFYVENKILLQKMEGEGGWHPLPRSVYGPEFFWKSHITRFVIYLSLSWSCQSKIT